MKSHIKRPRMTANWRIGSRKKDDSQSQIREIADKKTAYNEVCLYTHLLEKVGFFADIKIMGEKGLTRLLTSENEKYVLKILRCLTTLNHNVMNKIFVTTLMH